MTDNNDPHSDKVNAKDNSLKDNQALDKNSLNNTGTAVGENKQIKSEDSAQEKSSSSLGSIKQSDNQTHEKVINKQHATKTDKTILEVKDLQYRHVTKVGLLKPEREFVLGPISFTMQRGETIAIIGNNGAGKTLLAKALAGAIQPSSGSITFIDQDADPNQSKHKHPIRMILQHSASAMNPAVSVGSMMNNTLRLNTDLVESQRQQKIEETLLKVGLLRDHFYYYRHMLSDGQQQRVALARALILDPKIIVADEPFAALDPSVRSQTVNLILKLQHELGLGFVFISHNIGIVRHVSDRVLVLDKGQIIEQGRTDKVFAEPKEALTQKLVQAHFNLVERHLSLL